MKGSWIWDAYRQYAPNTYAVLRKDFSIDSESKVERITIQSACSGEYKLYFNGSYLFRGGAPCNEGSQYIDAFVLRDKDINELTGNKNTIAVLCYHFGKGLQYRPFARAGFRFMMQIAYENGKTEDVLSDDSWKITFPCCWDHNSPPMFYAVGFQEHADLSKYAPDMLGNAYDDTIWNEIDHAGSNDDPTAFGGGDLWEYAVAVRDYEACLLPRAIPFLKETDETLGRMMDWGECETDFNAMTSCNIADIMTNEDHLPLKSFKIHPVEDGFDILTVVASAAENESGDGADNKAGKDDSNEAVSDAGAVFLVFDAGIESAGYPKLEIESEYEGVIDFAYSECLDKRGRVDATRQGIKQADRLVVMPGKYSWQFFNRRAFRYIQLTFRGRAVKVKIRRLLMTVLRYPFEREAFFVSDNEVLNEIFDISKQTLKVCMKEVYEDCPLREHSQYIGDLRVQSLMNYYTFNDFHLIKEGLRQYARVQKADGWIPTVCPGSTQHNIIDYVPLWIVTLWDCYMFSGDRDLLKELYVTLKKLVEWLISNTDKNGLIPMKKDFWVFIDWSDIQKHGIVTALQCVYYRSLFLAGRIAGVLCYTEDRGAFLTEAAKVKKSINQLLWDMDKGLYHDCLVENSVKKGFSIQTQSFAILFDIADVYKKERIRKSLSSLSDVKIKTGYFKLYELETLDKLKEHEAFIHGFDFWAEMAAKGAKTWWETYDSDDDSIPDVSLCHGWSAGPLYLIPSKILGIRPLSPGFTKILIMPRMMGIKKCQAVFPTARGNIEFTYSLGEGVECMEIQIPENTQAIYVKHGQGSKKAEKYELTAGRNTLRFENNRD